MCTKILLPFPNNRLKEIFSKYLVLNSKKSLPRKNNCVFYLPQHFLNFLPLPQEQGEFLPILGLALTKGPAFWGLG